MTSVVVYLIHFNFPLVKGRKSCQHYLGSTNNFERRISEHRLGGSKAAKLMKYVKEAGIEWVVAKTWDTIKEERYALERKLKSQKNSKRFCKFCKEF